MDVRFMLIGIALIWPVSAASGQVITVTTVEDIRDSGYEASIEDLPGPDGLVSFAEAMIAANNTPGHQTIGFAIPLDELVGGRAYIHTGGGVGVHAYEATTIDGTTQTAFTGNTNPDGAEVAFFPGVIYLNADDCTFMGIDSSTVNVTGSNSLVHDNTNLGSINLFSGSGSLIENNTVSYIKIDRSNDNVVVNNITTRVRVLGWVGGGLPATNNRIGGPDLADRNYITGYGTWNSDGIPSGSTVQIFDAIGTLVENNWIGTTPDGMASGNIKSTEGVAFEGENSGNIIRNNLIAGIIGQCGNPQHCGTSIFGRGIYFNGSGSDYTIVGNTIGLNALGEPLLGGLYGIDVGYFNLPGITGVQIGGTVPGEGNIIAGHKRGVTVQKFTTGARISGNSIYANENLGIDLVTNSFGYGVTPNDALDTDTGGNGLQNFPVIASATRQGAAVHFAGMLHSSLEDDFMIEFFASPECDDSGFGEGQLYVGGTSVTTDAAGDASFDVTLSGSVPGGWVVTATATLEPLGATSEFSECLVVTGVALPADLDGDGDVDAADLGQLLGAWGPNPESPADMNDDDMVNASDLALLLGQWNS